MTGSPAGTSACCATAGIARANANATERTLRHPGCRILEPDQAIDFDHERAVFEGGVTRPRRVAFVRIDNKHLAARPIFPPDPEIVAEKIVAGAELHERAGKHAP